MSTVQQPCATTAGRAGGWIYYPDLPGQLVAWSLRVTITRPECDASSVQPPTRLPHSRTSRQLVEPLTPREIEVLQLLAQDESTREIARELSISSRTVESHLASIYGKLGVRGRAGAILWAMNVEFASAWDRRSELTGRAGSPATRTSRSAR